MTKFGTRTHVGGEACFKVVSHALYSKGQSRSIRKYYWNAQPMPTWNTATKFLHRDHDAWNALLSSVVDATSVNSFQEKFGRILERQGH